jgi:hypothetical protein
MGEPWVEALCLVEFSPRRTQLALLRVELSLHIMSFSTFRVVAQYLVHHLLGLVEMTCGRSIIDLIHGRICRRVSKHRCAERHCQCQCRCGERCSH